jgi:hypothetical protein
MKKSILYILPALLCVALAGCTKFVDKGLPDTFDDNDFWTSEDKVRTYNWEFYEMFAGFGNGASGGDFYFTSFTDDQAAPTFANYAVSPPATAADWSWTYIRKANILLERIDQVPIDEASKNHWKGVARFFRAFRYLQLVQAYGDVPWTGRSMDISETDLIYKPRDPRTLVMDSVLADIDFAVANLRVRDNILNTVNRDVALALKSRIGLYEGTYRKYHTELGLTGADKFLLAAKDAASQLFTAGYELSPDYQAVFNSLDLSAGPAVKEVLIHKKYVPGVLTHSVIGFTTGTTQMRGLTKSAIDAYLCDDGLPISLSPKYQGDDGIRNVRANRDKRMLITVDTFLCYNGSLVGGLSSSTGYRPSKYLQPRVANERSPYNDTDAPLFWLAEVLLNYAEACAELDQLGVYAITQADLDNSINKLRVRAGIPNLQLNGVQGVAVNGTPYVDPKKDADVSSLVWEIRRERRVELMMDGFRYQDILRWKKGYYMDSDRNPDIFLGARVPDNGSVLRNPDGYIVPYKAGTKRTFIDPKHYLSPIPTGQIALYPEGGLVQNPQW